MAKSPIAPARTVSSAAESDRAPGGTMNGIDTRNGSLQPACGTSSATARSASSLAECFMVFSSGSEGHVDAADEIPHRRLCEEVGDAEVELPALTHLGVRALVLGPRREVTTRQGQAHRARSDAGRPRGGGDVRQRQLAQLQKARVLEVPRLEAVEKRRVRRRLVLEGRAKQVELGADGEQTAELRGAVVQLVTPATVEQTIQTEVPQEVHFGGERRAAGGNRRPLEGVGIARRDLGEGVDQPIAVQVLERVWRAPVPAR